MSESWTESEETRHYLAFIKHFPEKDTDLLLTILKGHLLIEGLLRRLVELRLPRPAAFDHSKFSCSEIITLAEAMYGPATESWIWNAIAKLNTLRNKLAHSIEPTGIDDRLLHFLDIIESGRGYAQTREVEGHRRIYHAFFNLFFELAELLPERDKVKAFAVNA